MSTPEGKEYKESQNPESIVFDFKKETRDLFLLTEKIQVESIIKELVDFISPLDFLKKNDLVNYICSWKLGSKEKNDLEKMVDYMIYWSYENIYSRKENPIARKLKYILDNYWKKVDTILIEIKNKEESMKHKVSPKPKEEKKEEWISKLIPDRLKDVYNYWVEKLSNLWNFITESLPKHVKEWVKTNLFSPEKQENTEKINDIYKQLKWPEKPDFFPFYLAMQWYNKEKKSLWNSKYLTVVDYSKPVSENRLYVINMQTKTVENCVPTWHGKNSGNTKKTTDFSNEKGSNKTSIGFFRTPSTLKFNSRKTWKWLFLTWLEYSNNHANTNDPKTSRWIAVHSVWSFFYSKTENWHKAWDSTSEGCITIRKADNPNEIMNKIKWDSLIYSYYPDMTYLNKSTMIK